MPIFIILGDLNQMTFLYIIVGLVLAFDFINGFHDSANSIACVVSTKVLSPLAAVTMAAFFNFIAFVIFFAIDKLFRRLQLISASAFSLGHGANDAQKSMGIIWIALLYLFFNWAN